MAEDKEQTIRERAYALWESEGKPAGREDDHWHEAREQVESASTLAAESGQGDAPPKAAAPGAAAEDAEAPAAPKKAPRKRKSS